MECLALIMYFAVLTHHAGQMSSGAVRKLLVKGSQKKYDETLTGKLNAITRFQQAKRTTKALEAAGVSLEQYMLLHKTVLLNELYTFELDKIKTKMLEKVVVLQNIDVRRGLCLWNHIQLIAMLQRLQKQPGANAQKVAGDLRLKRRQVETFLQTQYHGICNWKRILGLVVDSETLDIDSLVLGEYGSITEGNVGGVPDEYGHLFRLAHRVRGLAEELNDIDSSVPKVLDFFETNLARIRNSRSFLREVTFPAAISGGPSAVTGVKSVLAFDVELYFQEVLALRQLTTSQFRLNEMMNPSIPESHVTEYMAPLEHVDVIAGKRIPVEDLSLATTEALSEASDDDASLSDDVDDDDYHLSTDDEEEGPDVGTRKRTLPFGSHDDPGVQPKLFAN